jgi:hypothetical protein
MGAEKKTFCGATVPTGERCGTGRIMEGRPEEFSWRQKKTAKSRKHSGEILFGMRFKRSG